MMERGMSPPVGPSALGAVPVVVPPSTTSSAGSSAFVPAGGPINVFHPPGDRQNEDGERRNSAGGAAGDVSTGKVIPRANFFPKAGGMRPRSRSFSDLKSAVPVSRSSLRSSLTASGGINKSNAATTPESPTSSSSLTTSPPSKPVKSSPLRPSPLSQSESVATNNTLKQGTPPQPTTQIGYVPRRMGSDGEGVQDPPRFSTRPIPVSRSTLPPGSSTSMLDVPGMSGTNQSTSPTVSVRSTAGRWLDDGDNGGETRSLVSPPPLALSPSGGNGSPVSPTAMTSSASGPSIGRQNSLRAKLSLPNLRRNRSRQDDGSGAPPLSPLESSHQDVVFQVQDMEFELVRPNFANHTAAARSSEDSAVLGRDAGSSLDGGPPSAVLPTPSSSLAAPPSSHLRPESPAMSINSFASGGRSPTAEGSHTSWMPSTSTSLAASSPMTASKPLPVESESQMEAHRNRELKWMSLLSSSAPSQARKSKKTRKLLVDGVPASVRYLVWSHLTDGKARCVHGVYAQLCGRGRVPMSGDIERDVEHGEWFGREEQGQLRVLRDAGGGIVQLLQAYLNMVPDIQYTIGLPHIVGQLLLLAPEEDAFWIFISIMDTHIRPYFSSGSRQLEVDSALFARALEVNDAAVAKRLLVDMGISPVSICAPWFSSLFVGCLPAEYLTRTWDLFLYDGIPFLFRVGLGIVSFVRRQLLESTSEEAVLALLHRPPPMALPPTPENYLSFVQSIKLKDDDVKKQRIKMEAQVKRQTQQQLQTKMGNGGGSISLPR